MWVEESTREEREATSSPKRRGRVKEAKVKRRSSVDWAKEDAQLRKPSDHSSVKAGSRERWWVMAGTLSSIVRVCAMYSIPSTQFNR